MASTNDRAGRRGGFHLTDLCVALAAAALLLGAVLPHAIHKSRSGGNRMACASNLRQIALAAITYAGQETRNYGRFPRTRWDPDAAAVGPPALYTGTDSPRSFAADPTDPAVPRANDVTAALYLLLKTSDLSPEVFNCPGDDATRYGGDVAARANWPGGRRHLSYSYNNPYPTRAAVAAGWKFDTTLGPDHPIAADMNHGDNPRGGPTRVGFAGSKKGMAAANSANHYFEGQQVAYVDGHVEWTTTPFCGAPRSDRAWRDNLYANAAGVNVATGVGGAVHGPPVDPQDAVLLPTASDGPAGAPTAAVGRVPGMSPPGAGLPWQVYALGAVAGAVGVLAAVGVVVARRERTRAGGRGRAGGG